MHLCRIRLSVGFSCYGGDSTNTSEIPIAYSSTLVGEFPISCPRCCVFCRLESTSGQREYWDALQTPQCLSKPSAVVQRFKRLQLPFWCSPRCFLRHHFHPWKVCQPALLGTHTQCFMEATLWKHSIGYTGIQRGALYMGYVLHTHHSAVPRQHSGHTNISPSVSLSLSLALPIFASLVITQATTERCVCVFGVLCLVSLTISYEFSGLA